jgi:hypothetical protein
MIVEHDDTVLRPERSMEGGSTRQQGTNVRKCTWSRSAWWCRSQRVASALRGSGCSLDYTNFPPLLGCEPFPLARRRLVRQTHLY